MAQTSILSSISRTGTFPIRKTINAPNNCGTISLVLNQNWTEQMIHELPTINVAVYIDTDIKLLSIDIDMSTVTSDNIELRPITPYSIPLFDLPTDFDFVVTPIFDEDALLSHNLQIDSGDIDVFNTSDNGIVDTNISSYINEYWTTKTDTFNLNMVFDNSNIASGGSGGGGGGGQITVDTQVMQGSTNPVQNGAIYDFVNSSVSTNTAYFIGTFNSLSDLENYSGEVSNNDYAFVVSVDSNSNTVYNRYKYNSENETWNFEYSLNNSSFTAAEWETIQSGLTANDRTNYNNHLTNTNNPHSVTKEQVGLGNVDNTSDANKPVSTAMQIALNGKQNTLTFDGTYNASTNKAATVSTVTNAINDLDVSSVGGSGKYISAISETNGKISPTVETMDTTPTSGSEKAVTSGAVYTALASKQDALSQSQLAAANSGITAAKLTADETALGEVINGGAAGTKNLLDCSLQSIKAVTQNPAYGFSWNGNVCTSTRGASFTINADNSITVAATNMQNDVWFKLTDFMYSAGSYVISGCPTNGSTSSYYIESDALNYRDIGNGVSFIINSTTTDSIYIIVKSGQTFEKTFYPMLCPKVLYDADTSYVPYASAKTNVEITPALAEVVDAGAKNLFDYDVLGPNTTNIGTSIVVNGVRFTMNSDKSVTITRESTSSQSAYVWFRKSDGSAAYATDFCDDAHVFSGAAGGSVSTYTLYIYNINGSGTSKYFGEGGIIGTPQVTPNAAGISIAAGYSPSNLVIKPMICTKTEWDISHKFVPYALPNPTLTPAVIKAVDEGAKNLLKFDYISGGTAQGGGTSWTSNGVEFSLANGEITVNRTSASSSDATCQLYLGNSKIYIDSVCDGGHILSGCPSGGSTSTYMFGAYRGNYTAVDTGSGAELGTTTQTLVYLQITIKASYSPSNLKFRPMICTAADWNVSQKYVPYRLSYQQISDAVLNKTPVVYGFHVNPNESDPSAAVTYLLGAVGMTPAKMGSSTFSYGSWKNAFFMPKPCMLKSDGTVDYYLNPDDYTKKSDGTASDVANASYDGNAMMEWPKIWFKYVPGGVDGEWEFYVSNQNVDGTYKCWCNINAAGQEIDHFYTAIYNGTGTTKLRSISGVQLTTANGADNTTRQQEIDRALANNTGTNVMWYTEVWSDRLLINALLYLIGKSLNLQSTFGQGMTSGSQTAKQNYYTGGKLDSNSTFNLNNKGLFWGDITNTTNPVKVFGMENLWGCVNRSCAGLLAVDNALKVKLTYDVQDGSTAHGYNLTGNGYLSFGTSASSGYVTKMKADTDKGYIVSSAGGTGAGASTYYCDYYNVNTSGTRHALLGGLSAYGAVCGFSVDLNNGVSAAYWPVSAALSCKPQS